MKRRRTIYAADLFCGGGGTSTGLLQAAAGMGLDVELLAVNHWDTAVETHAANHPKANHLCASLDQVDPSKVIPGGKLDLLVASPECVHFSTARGGKPMDDQSRASAWHVLHWAERLRVQRILIENVREFLTWGPLGANGQPLKSHRGETFAAFVHALESLGYAVEWRVLNCADHGDATTRKRLFIQAVRSHGGRRPAWPLASHEKAPTVHLDGRRLAPWRPARDILDWSIEGKSIFARERPLAPTTMKRIEEGIRRFWGPAGEPFLVLLRGTGADQIPSTARPLSEPLPSPTAGGGHAALIEPFLLSQQSGGVPRPVSEPSPTIAASGAVSMVEPFLAEVNHGQKPGEGREGGNAYRTRSLREPLPTITGTSRCIGVVSPFIVTPGGPDLRGGRSTDGPLPTVTCKDRMAVVEPFVVKTAHRGANGAYVRRTSDPLYAVTTAQEEQGVLEPFVVSYDRTGQARPVSAPVKTLTTHDRLGLAEPAALDIRFRMLQPHELAAAMSFPKDYQFKGNKSDVVRQIGNAVPVSTARALCAAALAGVA